MNGEGVCYRVFGGWRIPQDARVIEVKNQNARRRHRGRFCEPSGPREVIERSRPLPCHETKDDRHDCERTQAIRTGSVNNRERDRGEINTVNQAKECNDPCRPPMPVGTLNEGRCRQSHVCTQSPDCSGQTEKISPAARQDNVAAASDGASLHQASPPFRPGEIAGQAGPDQS
jgi:hypothetical protein